MVYLVSVCFSCALLSLHNRYRLCIGDRKTGISISEIIVVIIFTTLTACRAYSVGTDTINYYYSAQRIQNISSIQSVLQGYLFEPGYGLLEYMTMKLFGDIHILFMIEGVVLLAGVFSFIHNFDGKISYSLAFLVFFSFYYNTSLNISRQYLAVGIGLFAAKYLFSNQKLKYFLLSFCAMLFHSSGILLFASFFIWKFLSSATSDRSYRKRYAILILAIVIACALIRPIAILLGKFGIMPAKYISLLNQSNASSTMLYSMISAFPLLVLIFLFQKELIKKDQRNRLVIALYFLGFILSLLNSISPNVGRVAAFWTSWQIILYPECCNALVSHQKSYLGVFFTKFLFVAFFFAYWFYSYYYRNFGETMPYCSSILPFLNW